MEDKPTVSAGIEEVNSVSGDSDESSDYGATIFMIWKRHPSQACFNVGSVVHATWLEETEYTRNGQ